MIMNGVEWFDEQTVATNKQKEITRVRGPRVQMSTTRGNRRFRIGGEANNSPPPLSIIALTHSTCRPSTLPATNLTHATKRHCDAVRCRMRQVKSTSMYLASESIRESSQGGSNIMWAHHPSPVIQCTCARVPCPLFFIVPGSGTVFLSPSPKFPSACPPLCRRSLKYLAIILCLRKLYSSS